MNSSNKGINQIYDSSSRSNGKDVKSEKNDENGIFLDEIAKMVTSCKKSEYISVMRKILQKGLKTIFESCVDLKKPT